MAETPDFYINFNPDTSLGFFGDADGGPETALVFREMPCGRDGHTWTGDHFYILKGDFRADYEAVVAEYRANGCDRADRWSLKSDVYDKLKKRHGSRHSTDFHEWGTDGTVRKARPKGTPRKGKGKR